MRSKLPALLFYSAIVNLMMGCTAAVVPVDVGIAPPAIPPHRYVEIGLASWYGPHHQGRLTASGERFDMHKLTAAHPSLPLDSKAKVTNLENGKSVEVTINDRGPYIGDRIIDLSARAAQHLGMKKQGLATVRIESMETLSAAAN